MLKIFRRFMPDKCRNDLQRAADIQAATATRVAILLAMYRDELVVKMQRPSKAA